MTVRGLLGLTLLLCCSPAARGVENALALAGNWKRDGLATLRFQIQGTGGRNNPLRRSLESPFSGDELFVRFGLRYHADSIDTPADGNGEFFVLWLDQTEGGDASTHSSNVPNIGLHVSGDENRFMVRYRSGNEKHADVLEGGRDYVIVGRLWKSSPGNSEPFDQLDLWIDPTADEELSPDASIHNAKSLSEVGWIGFSTGSKTETDDRIEVWGINVAETWQAILGLSPETPTTETPAPVKIERSVGFTEHVLPILETRCFECHAGEDASEGVRLDVLDEVLNRTAPRDAKASRLFQLVSSGEMPPEEDRLSDEELAIVRAWIDEGLDWDEQRLPTPIPKTDHWAFQPIRRPEVPKVIDASWIRTPIDAFIARRHEDAGLRPNAAANIETLRRRLSLDMLGLPPDPTRIAEQQIDIEAILSHPAYGVRWARHWLDVARWAESNGHQHNRHRPYAWRYRDWVVNALNNDLPYDQFIRQQIAGDEIEPFRDEHIIATGFLAAARYSGNELDKQIQRNDILVDITNTTASALLGLTLECAQCHTHKFDPLSIRDYYRFQAFFANGQPGNMVLAAHQTTARPLIEQRWQIFDKVHGRMVNVRRKQGYPEPIYVIPKSVVGGMNGKERARFQQLEKEIAALDQSWGFYSPKTAHRPLPIAPHEMRWPLPRDESVLKQIQTSLLIRGDVQSPGPEVTPAWPIVFGALPENDDMPLSRLALADWMTDAGNPLVARVWVNRIWQWHFGRGLVETSGDFGTQGTPPTHPELLDFLATELIDSGWSTRHIHRLILNSATYRQSSEHSEHNAAIDPDNRLLWRWVPKRLEAESIRDSILAVSGQLDNRLGGASDAANSKRRSLYLRQRRDNFPHQQILFDGTGGVVSCSRRRVSTNALQPLWLMNSEVVQQAAQTLARRAGSVESAIEISYGRSGNQHEVAALTELADDYGLASACLAILNSSEFLYIP